MGASRTRQVSTKVNVEAREKLGQSAQSISRQFLGRVEMEATVADRRAPSSTEQSVGIFCLPGFVEDRGQISFSRHASSFMCVCSEIFVTQTLCLIIMWSRKQDNLPP
jgi:hypothetical protein